MVSKKIQAVSIFGMEKRSKPWMQAISFTNQVMKCQALLFKFPWVRSSSDWGNVFLGKLFVKYETTI